MSIGGLLLSIGFFVLVALAMLGWAYTLRVLSQAVHLSGIWVNTLVFPVSVLLSIATIGIPLLLYTLWDTRRNSVQQGRSNDQESHTRSE